MAVTSVSCGADWTRISSSRREVMGDGTDGIRLLFSEHVAKIE